MKEASCSKRGTKSYRDVDDEESKRKRERETLQKRGLEEEKRGRDA